MFQITQMFILTVSAAVAAATFAFSVAMRRREKRETEILRWQRGIVHKIFQERGTERLAFDDIIQAYRSEATAVSKGLIGPEQLTRDALRQILLGLISARVIDQLGEDMYMLHLAIGGPEPFPQDFAAFLQVAHQAMESDAQMRSLVGGGFDEWKKRTFGDMDAANNVLTVVSDDPHKYSVSDLVLKLSKNDGSSPESVKAQVVRLLAKRELARDASEKLYIPVANVG